MYLPNHFEEHDVAKLHAVISQHPLATWIVCADEQLEINHIPFLLDKNRGKHGTLVGHVARANPIWQRLTAECPSAILFHGEQSYISPSWYPSKQKHHKAVPTWNYIVVHAHGTARAIEDRDWLRSHVTQLSDKHESVQGEPWHISQAPGDYLDKMLSEIVGIEIPIDKLIGKFKLSQNRSTEDQRGIVSGLQSTDDGTSLAMAELIRHRLDQ